MNYIKILCFSAVITGLGSIVSCGDAKYDTLDTHAYIEEALSSTSQKVTVQAKIGRASCRERVLRLV